MEKGGEISGLISIIPPIAPLVTSSAIKTIITPKDSFLRFLKYAQDTLPFISIRKTTKFKGFYRKG